MIPDKIIKYKGVYICKLADLYDSYKELNNVWKVGKKFGLSGQLVHANLSRHGLSKPMNIFTKEDANYLNENYLKYRVDGRLKDLAAIMNRTDAFISRKARLLGLTDRSSHISFKHKSKEVSERMKKYFRENPHPKGMLGKKHTQEVVNSFSINAKAMWKDPNSKFNSQEYRQKKSDYMSKFMSERMKSNSVNNYNRVKRGTVDIGGKVFFARSSWECNVAAYLNFLKLNKEILDWEHEPETFWFEKIKRGVRSYLPDFKITKRDGSFYFLEVKGWMDSKSATKIKRMALYYPNIELQVISSKRYNEIKKNSAIIKQWGLLDSDDFLGKIKLCSIEGCEEKNFSSGYCRKHHYLFMEKANKEIENLD